MINLINPHKNIHDNLNELFNHQETIYSLLIGQSLQNKEKENELLDSIPKELYDYKYLMHPIRLGFMRLLYTYNKLSSVEIKEKLDLSWRDYSTHMKTLKANGYISVKDEFESGLKRQMIYLEFHGKQDFEAVLNLLTDFVKSTPHLNEFTNRRDTLLYPEK